MGERELELIDYLAVLWRWKWLIVAGTVACALVAAVVSWALPNRYYVSATIDAGDLTPAGMRDVDRLVARLNAVGLAADERALMGAAGPGGFTARFKRPVMVELGLVTDAPAEAARALTASATKVVDELNRILEWQDGQIEAVERRADDLRRDLENLRRARTAALRKAEDPVGALVYARLSEEIVKREKSLIEAGRVLLGQPQRGRRARLVAAPEVPRIPNRPRLKMYLAVGLVGGFMGSVLLAFFVDYLEQARRRARGRPVASSPEDMA